jgi:hypothetical protein
MKTLCRQSLGSRPSMGTPGPCHYTSVVKTGMNLMLVTVALFVVIMAQNAAHIRAERVTATIGATTTASAPRDDNFDPASLARDAAAEAGKAAPPIFSVRDAKESDSNLRQHRAGSLVDKWTQQANNTRHNSSVGTFPNRENATASIERVPKLMDTTDGTPFKWVDRNTSRNTSHHESYGDGTSEGVDLLINDDHCWSSKMHLPCSGHGSCEYDANTEFGVTPGSVKKCRCDNGWFGRGCQKRLTSGEKTMLEKQLQGAYDNAPTTEQLSQNPGLPVDHSKSNEEHTTFSTIDGHDRDSPAMNADAPFTPQTAFFKSADAPPARTAMTSWAAPDSRELWAGGRVMAQLAHEEQIARHDAPPSKYVQFRKLLDEAKKPRFALYTDIRGKTIVAPAMYDGQQGFDDPTKQNLDDNSSVPRLSMVLNTIGGDLTIDYVPPHNIYRPKKKPVPPPPPAKPPVDTSPCAGQFQGEAVHAMTCSTMGGQCCSKTKDGPGIDISDSVASQAQAPCGYCYSTR